jgi:magnesium-transporting ATPase (P-type)
MNHSYICRLREALGVCHTIIIEEKTDEATGVKFVGYNASSPDELALVNGARHLGFAFQDRDENGNLVCHVEGKREPQKYELLNVIEFDSDRKRMSVIVRTP